MTEDWKIKDIPTFVIVTGIFVVLTLCVYRRQKGFQRKGDYEDFERFKKV